MSLVISRTRKDHECAYCHKVIPVGTEAKVLAQEGFGTTFYGGEYPVRGKSFHRTYWHPDCPTIIRRMKSLHDMTNEEFDRYMKVETEEDLQKFMVDQKINPEDYLEE